MCSPVPHFVVCSRPHLYSSTSVIKVTIGGKIWTSWVSLRDVRIYFSVWLYGNLPAFKLNFDLKLSISLASPRGSRKPTAELFVRNCKTSSRKSGWWCNFSSFVRWESFSTYTHLVYGSLWEGFLYLDQHTCNCNSPIAAGHLSLGFFSLIISLVTPYTIHTTISQQYVRHLNVCRPSIITTR